MATVDSLDIEISTSAKKASAELGKIKTAIDSVAKSIKSIDTSIISSRFKELSKNISNINTSGLSKVSESAKKAEESIKKAIDSAKNGVKTKLLFDASDYQNAINELRQKFSEAGKSFKPSGNLSELEKQSEKLSSKLDALVQKEQEIIAIGRKSPESEMFEKLQYSISQTKNKLDILGDKINSIKDGMKAPSSDSDFQIINTNSSSQTLDYFVKELEKFDAEMEKSAEKLASLNLLDTPIKNIETNLQKLQSMFPEEEDLIESYKSELEKLQDISINTPKVDTRNTFESIAESAKESAEEAGRVINDSISGINTEGIQSDYFRNFGQEVKEATERLKGLEAAGKGMGTDAWDEAYIALQKVKEEARQYKEQLDNPSDGFEEDIKKTDSLGNKVDELKQKLKELKSQGFNFGDADFDKTYKELQKSENELKKYKSSLDGAGKESSKFSSLSVPNFEKVTSSIQKMGSNISSALKKMSSGISSSVKGIGSLLNPIKNVSSSSNSLSKSIGKLFVAFQALRGLGGLLKKSIDISSDLTEVQNVIDVTFGKYKDKIEDLAKISVPEFGMSELTAKQIAGRFQAMGVAIGYSQGKMSDMSVELTKLAADMASFYNVEQADVAKSLESVFTGTTEPLRRYGLDLTQATLEEWAHKKGIDAKMKSMSQAEKTMLRYQYVMANTSAAQGDFARTADTWANQIRVLKQSFEVLGSTVGGVLINVLKPFVKGLNTIMGYINEFAKTVSNALGKIFGWTFEEGGGVVNDAADATEDLAGGMEDVADATDKAAKKQKKFNKQLSKIDELMNYTTTKTGGKDTTPSSGAGDLGSLGGATSSGQWMQGESILKKFESEIDSLYKLGEYISESLTKAMESIDWDSVYEKAEGFGSGLADFLNGLFTGSKGKKLFETTGKTIAKALKAMLKTALSFSKKFKWKNFGENLATGLNSFFENFDWELTGTTFSTLADGILNAIKSAGETIEWKNVGSVLAKSVKTFFKTFDWNLLPSTFNTFANGILYGILGALGEIKVSDWKKVAQKIANLISEVDVGGITWKLGKIANSLSQAFYALVSNKDTWKNLGQKIADGINGFFKGMNEVNAETGLTGFQSLGKSISSTISGLFNTISNALEKTEWEAIGGSIVDFFANINWVDILSGAAKLIASIAKGIFALLKGALEKDIEYLKKYLPEWIENIGIFFINLGVNIGEKASSFSKKIKKFVKNLPENIIKLAIGIGTKINELSKKITNFLRKIPRKFFEFALKIGSKASNIASNIAKFLSEIPSKAFNFVLKIGSKIPDIAKKIGEFINKLPAKAFGFGLKILSKVIDIGKDIEDFLKKIPNKFFGILIKIVSTIKDVNDKIVEFIKDLPKNSVGIILNLASTVKEFNEKIRDFISKVFALGGIGINIVMDIEEEAAKSILKKLGLPKAASIALDVKGSLDKKATQIKEWFSGKKEQEKEFLAKAKGKTEKTFTSVKEAWAGFKEGSKSLLVKAKGKIEGAFNKVKEAWKGFKEGTKTVWAKAKGTADKVFNSIGEKWNSFKEGAKDLYINAKGKIEDTFDDAVLIWEDVKEGAKDIWVSLKGKTEKSFDDVAESWKKVKDKTAKLTADAVEKTKGAIKGIKDKWEEIKSKKETLTAYAVEGTKTVFSSIQGKWKGIKSKTATLTGKAVETGASVFKKIKSAWNSISTKTATLTATFKDYFTSPLKTAWNALAKTINGAIKTINKIPGVDIGVRLPTLAKGGIYKNGKWQGIPKYATGGFPDHGTMFIAGEAGAEAVAHIGGQTEVLNKSQLAGAMYESVLNANAESNALLREQNRLLVQILNKETGINASDIFSAVRAEDSNYKKRTGHGAFVY